MLSVEKQIFLQQMLSKDYLLFDDALILINKIVTELNKATDDPPPNEIGVREIKSIIKEINREIKPEVIQLSMTTCEATGKKHLTLHSIKHNEITELQTFYTPLELAYWLPLMEEIIKSDAKSMNKIDCLNLVNKYQLHIKMEDAERFLNKCTQKGYLVLNNGLYYLGSKTICEFNRDLRRTYEDYIHNCELCSEICCYGKPCVNCNKFMHDYCLQAALSTNKECPLCHVQWGDFDFEPRQVEHMSDDSDENVGVEIAEEVIGGDENSGDDDDEGEESGHDNDEEEMEIASQSSRSTRSSQRSQRKKAR